MRKFGAQPLFPENTAAKLRSAVPVSNDLQQRAESTAADLSMVTKPQQQQPRRRMKAFAAPRPLNTTIQPLRIDKEHESESSLSPQEANPPESKLKLDSDSFSNYARFLESDNTDLSSGIEPVGAGTSMMTSRLRSSVPWNGRKESAGRRRFGVSPLLSINNSSCTLTQEFPNEVTAQYQQHRNMRDQQQKESYLNSKKLQQQPLLPNSRPTEENDLERVRAVRTKPVIQTKTFQPSSRRVKQERRKSVEEDENYGIVPPVHDFLQRYAGSGDQQKYQPLGSEFVKHMELKEPSDEKTNGLYDSGHFSEYSGGDTVPAVSASNSLSRFPLEYSKGVLFDFSFKPEPETKDSGESFTADSEDAHSTNTYSGPEVKTEDERKISRGKKLLEMIRLDRVEFRAFHADEYDYEKYMAFVRTANCVQVSTQTFEDGMDESTQTEPEETRTKWTQKPPGWFGDNNATTTKVQSAKAEVLGVGDDTDDISNEAKLIEKSQVSLESDIREDREKLNKFLHRSTRLMLAILSSQKELRLPTGNVGTKDTKTLVRLESSFKFLEGLEQHSLYTDGNLIASCNGPNPTPLERTKLTTSSQQTILTVWTLKEPTVPLYFLRVWGTVTSVQIQSELFVIAIGCKDGSIHFFNLKEDAFYHKQEDNQTLRSASVNTSLLNIPNHISPIVGLGIVRETRNCVQVISLDKSKFLVSWSLFLSINLGDDNPDEFHQSQWSQMKLKLRTVINLLELFSVPQIEMLNLAIWQSQTNAADVNYIFGTNSGFVGKSKIGAGMQSFHDRYESGLVPDAIVKITSIDLNLAFDLFASGCQDGFCRLFTFPHQHYLLALNCHDSPLKVRWSKRRGCLIYIGFRNRIEFWDLLSSDVTPDKRIKLECLLDFEVFNTNVGEFLVTLTPDGLSVGSPPNEVLPLDSRDEARFKMYFELISSGNDILAIDKRK